MIYCPNESCQSVNSETQQCCQTCGALLPKRYLWLVGEGSEDLDQGDLLADRYLIQQERIALDTKPGQPPVTPELPQTALPYLKLFPYRLHVPQIYDVLTGPQLEAGRSEPLLLLEQGAIVPPTRSQPSAVMSVNTAIEPPRQSSPEPSPGTPEGQPDAAAVRKSHGPIQLLPMLSQTWTSGSALRQLNWLWQIAQLWQPLAGEQVVSSLLNPRCLRVQGPTVRLLELTGDRYQAEPLTLAHLGQLWSGWAGTAQPEIAQFFESLCQQLIQKQIRTTEQLVQVLDEGLLSCGQSQTRTVAISTRTDQGPNRNRNEDACYPDSGAALPAQPITDANPLDNLLIVCDGIGGHQGGNVASALAIESVQRDLQTHLSKAPLQADDFATTLELAVCAANDEITQRNDREQRQERQRMGTTLVMAIAQAHELYITNLGDSRAYWITPHSCQQITIDDDLAVREVRLGYAMYRDALQRPSSGSLIQALGMGPSNHLYPSVQRFVLDQDGLFLLCSDGLSDNDRVDEIWQTELLPVLQGQTDLATACRRLVEVANTRNGHDNVTVGLMHIQVASSDTAQGQGAAVPASLASPAPARQSSPIAARRSAQRSASPQDSTQKTVQLSAPASASPQANSATRSLRLGPVLLGLLLILGVGGVLVAIVVPGIGLNLASLFNPAADSPSNEATPPIEPVLDPPTPADPVSLRVGSIFQLSRSTVDRADSTDLLRLQAQPPAAAETASDAPQESAQGDQGAETATQATDADPQEASSDPASSNSDSDTSASASPDKILPAGAILKVVSQRRATADVLWLKLKVCEVPANPAESAESAAAPDAAGEEETGTEAAPSAPSPSGSPGDTPPSDSASTSALPQPGDDGWVQATLIQPLAQAATLQRPSPCTASGTAGSSE